jgi:hypothetical protein
MDTAFLCAHWDGNHIWIQWPGGVESLRWRVRKQGSCDWQEWHVLPALAGDNLWMVIPTWSEDAEVQAEVYRSGEWFRAVPADFLQSSALFSLQNKTTSDITISAGSLFHAAVDDAACCYELPQDIVITAEKSLRVHMRTLHASGYSQLDYSSHFRCETESLVVENVEPSTDDLKILPGDSAIIRARPMSPVTLAIVQ